jgi:hypothetical protein
MVSRRWWSQWVFAEYSADDGSLFGGNFLRIVDTRETVATQGEHGESERMFGYDDDTSQDGRAGAQTPVIPGLAPTSPERSPMMHQTHRDRSPSGPA